MPDELDQLNASAAGQPIPQLDLAPLPDPEVPELRTLNANAGRPEWDDDRYTTESRAKDFFRAHALADTNPYDVGEEAKARFGVDRNRADQNLGLERARLKIDQQEESDVMEAKRKAIPFGSAVINYRREKAYAAAVKAYNDGTANPGQLEFIATFERDKKRDEEAASTVVGGLGEAAKQAPAFLGELAVGGKLVRGGLGLLGFGKVALPPLQAAINPSVGGKLLQGAATQALATPLAPSMYLQQGAQNARLNPDQSTFQSYAPAVAMATAQNAVLGTLQNLPFVNKTPTLLGRSLVKGVFGSAEMGAVEGGATQLDRVTKEITGYTLGLDTQHGTFGKLIREEKGGIKDALVQTLTFAAFAGMHDPALGRLLKGGGALAAPPPVTPAGKAVVEAVQSVVQAAETPKAAAETLNPILQRFNKLLAEDPATAWETARDMWREEKDADAKKLIGVLTTEILPLHEQFANEQAFGQRGIPAELGANAAQFGGKAVPPGPLSRFSLQQRAELARQAGALPGREAAEAKRLFGLGLRQPEPPKPVVNPDTVSGRNSQNDTAKTEPPLPVTAATPIERLDKGQIAELAKGLGITGAALEKRAAEDPRFARGVAQLAEAAYPQKAPEAAPSPKVAPKPPEPVPPPQAAPTPKKKVSLGLLNRLKSGSKPATVPAPAVIPKKAAEAREAYVPGQEKIPEAATTEPHEVGEVFAALRRQAVPESFADTMDKAGLTEEEKGVLNQRLQGDSLPSFRELEKGGSIQVNGKPVSYQTYKNREISALKKLQAHARELFPDVANDELTIHKLREGLGLANLAEQHAVKNAGELLQQKVDEQKRTAKANEPVSKWLPHEKIADAIMEAVEGLDPIAARRVADHIIQQTQHLIEPNGERLTAKQLADEIQKATEEVSDARQQLEVQPESKTPVRSQTGQVHQGEAQADVPSPTGQTSPGRGGAEASATPTPPPDNATPNQPGNRRTATRAQPTRNQLKDEQRSGSLLKAVQKAGGLKRSESTYFGYATPEEMGQNYPELGEKLFRDNNNKPGRQALDTLAEELRDQLGQVPSHLNPADHLAEQLKKGAFATDADLTRTIASKEAQHAEARQAEDEFREGFDEAVKDHGRAEAQEAVTVGQQATIDLIRSKYGDAAAEHATDLARQGFDIFHDDPEYNQFGRGDATGGRGGAAVDAATKMLADKIAANSPQIGITAQPGNFGGTSSPLTLRNRLANIREDAVAMVRGLHDFLSTLGSKSMVKVDRLSTKVGEAWSWVANSHNHAEELANVMVDDVMGVRERQAALNDAATKAQIAGDAQKAKQLNDEAAKLGTHTHLDRIIAGAVWQERRFRRAREQFLKEAQQASNLGVAAKQAGNKAEAKKQFDLASEYGQKARDVGTVIGGKTPDQFLKNPLATEADFQHWDKDPLTNQILDRFGQKFVPINEAYYRQVMGLGPNDPIPSRTQLEGLEASSIPKKAGEESKTTVVMGGGSGSLRGPKIRPFGASKEFTGSSEHGYEIDLGEIIRANLADRIPKAAKAEAYRVTEAEGLGKWAKGGVEPPEFQGQKGRRFEDVNPPKGTQTAEEGQKHFWMHPDVEESARRALKTDRDMPPLPGTALSAYAALVTSGDFVSHLKNLGTSIFSRKVNIKDVFSAAHDLFYGDIKARYEIADLARIDALRAHGADVGKEGLLWGGKYDPSVYMSRILTFADRTMRLAGARSFERLVKENPHIENTESNKRNFINQMNGNYNKATQSRLVKVLRDTGLGPFATAAGTFFVHSLRTLALRPGLRTTTWSADLRLRAEMLGRLMVLPVGTALANFAAWGRVDGDDNTPVGALKIGEWGGKTRYIDLMGLTGITRGLRETGLLASIEGQRSGAKRAGSTLSESTGRGLHDALISALHPALGPPVSFLNTLITGTNTLGVPIAERAKKGESQAWNNAAEAFYGLNPLLEDVIRPIVNYAADVKAGKGERSQHRSSFEPTFKGVMKYLGPFGVKSSDHPPGKPLPPRR